MINYLYRKNVVNIKVKIPKNKLIYYSLWWSDKFNGNDIIHIAVMFSSKFVLYTCMNHINYYDKFQ